MLYIELIRSLVIDKKSNGMFSYIFLTLKGMICLWMIMPYMITLCVNVSESCIYDRNEIMPYMTTLCVLKGNNGCRVGRVWSCCWTQDGDNYPEKNGSQNPYFSGCISFISIIQWTAREAINCPDITNC